MLLFPISEVDASEVLYSAFISDYLMLVSA